MPPLPLTKTLSRSITKHEACGIFGVRAYSCGLRVSSKITTFSLIAAILRHGRYPENLQNTQVHEPKIKSQGKIHPYINLIISEGLLEGYTLNQQRLKERSVKFEQALNLFL